MSCLLTQQMSCLQTQQMSRLQTQQISCLQTQQVCLLQTQEALQRRGFATGKPSKARFCHWKTLQRRILPPENLPTPGFGFGKTSLTASDLEAEALAIRVKVHWAIWLRSGLLTKVWCLDARFWCQKRTLFLEVVPDGLVMGGLGMG